MKHGFRKLTLFMVTLVASLLLLIGCGGSGSGSSSFSLFVTDDAHNGYSGVWVKVYKATLKSTTATSVDVFTSTDGLTVNMRALHDGAAKFLLLAPGQVPDGTYNQIVFELDKNVTLVATPSGTVSSVHFPDSLDATIAGHSNLTMNLSPAITVPGSPKVVVDFDLKNWTIAGGVITPVLTQHPGTGIDDPTRHEKFEFHGLVSGLSGTAPIQSFTMTLKWGGTVTVTTDDTTSIIADGSATALANGQKVEVYGAYDPTTSSIAAKIIRAESEFEDEAKAVGLASNGIEANHSFTLAPSCVRGFAPQGETISVATNGTTKYRGRHGVTLTETQFYAALVTAGANAVVEAEGTFDVNSNTLTAKSVSIENEAEFGEDEARGATSSPSFANLSFDVSVTEAEGFDPPTPLHVVATSDAQYKDKNGNTLTASQFFDVITANSKTVKVKGSFAANVFTATRLEIR